MPLIMEIGQVSVIHKGTKCEVEWELDFKSISETNGKGFWSPDFNYEGESWCMRIYPVGRTSGSLGYIDLVLDRVSDTDDPMNVQLSFSFKTLNGRKEFQKQATHDFNFYRYFHSSRFLSRSDFERRRSEFLSPSGMLTVVCTLKRPDSAGSMSNVAAANCSYCEKSFSVREISSHERKCRVKCPHCSDVILLQNWDEHECQRSGSDADGKLADDLQGMLTCGNHSDVIIKVKGEEFLLHKCILSARSPYFNSMFNSDMREKNTGVVCIDDCEPDVFRSFIHFLYTGKLENLSPENVCGLYEISDKYQEDLLKEKCLQFMKNSLTVESFTNFILIALRHNEKELLEKATSFFVNNTKDIICDVKWLNFMKEYPVYANELHIKSLDVHRGKS